MVDLTFSVGAAGRIIVAAALCIACEPSGATPPPAASPSTGGAHSATIAPDFTARDVDGATFRLSDHLGRQVILLDFWSTICEPCKAEFPHLRAMYARDRGQGLLVVGVAMDGPETVADVPSFVKRFGVDFPVVLDDDSRIASLYNPKKSMPLSVLIDRVGHIAVVREGYNPGDERLVAADVATALAQSAP
jgi:peroxiredoxin